MRQVIICGRGGQGVMEAAELLASALWRLGKSVQAFPTFQPEKRGAATAAFVRYDTEEIWLSCEVDRADAMIVLDLAALLQLNPLERMLPGGLLVMNCHDTSHVNAWAQTFRVVSLNASQIALTHKLGSRLDPQVNLIMLAAFARASDELPLPTIVDTINERTMVKTEELRVALKEAYKQVIEVTP